MRSRGRSAAALLSGIVLAACTASTSDPPAVEEAPPPPGSAPSDEAAPPPATKPAPERAAGCARAPSGVGATSAKQLSAAGKPRTYHLSVPATYDASVAHALVFVLHGAGDTSPEDMQDWFAVEASMSDALFVYPQALARTRADGTGGMIPRWDVTGSEDLALFDAVVDATAESHCVDRARVFVTGFSSGGNLSQQIACTRSAKVRAFAAVAGPGPFSASCDGAVAAWMTHDADDDALPVSGARSSRDFWAKANGCGSSWADEAGSCKRNTSCAAGRPLVYCETTGVGHDVPSGAPQRIAAFFESLE